MMNRFVSIIRMTLVSVVLLGIQGAQAHEGATGGCERPDGSFQS